MISNVGHTIQKLINNTPVAVSIDNATTSVATNGGSLYQAGMVDNHIENTFKEITSGDGAVGKIVDVESVAGKVYLLNASGSVFSRGNAAHGGVVREVYSPGACGGDKAVHISSGKDHVLILTENNKVWGAGSNEKYQLVPQGQCKYDTAVELFITDTNLHDNHSCNSFMGVYNEMKCPTLPQFNNQCAEVSCIKNTRCDVHLGYLDVEGAVVDPPGTSGIFSVPVYGDISYVGFLCIDGNDCVSGTLSWTVTRIYIKCGCFVSKFTTQDEAGCHVKEFNTSSTKEVVLFSASQCPSANTDTCSNPASTAYTGSTQIAGRCGECVVVNIDLTEELELPTVSSSAECQTIILTLGDCSTSLTGLCDTSLLSVDTSELPSLALDVDVRLDCYRKETNEPLAHLPQPCWSAVYAGGDISVLKDSCNRLYVLGSLHEVRSNKNLAQGSCLSDLLSNANASISFPADQLNCKGNNASDDCRCDSNGNETQGFQTDLAKFGVHLNFPGGRGQCDERLSVCDFLDRLKKCNENPTCEPVCEPCDGYIHINIDGTEDCEGASVPQIGSITIFNKKSICKLVSQGRPDIKSIRADLSTMIEFDLNKYCIDTTDVALDRIVKLDFCNDGPCVILYVDVDVPGGIKFTSGAHDHNVEFSVSASTPSRQFILNFGSLLDPVELTNLKYALSLDCYYPCAQFKNPFDTKITNTYLRGGDRVKFVSSNPKNIRQAVTADIPTVFRLNKRIIDVAVGENNLSVLAGGLSCPNEIFAIGRNCHGELGLGNNISVVCFGKVNRCQFDCQVSSIYAGPRVTFYSTQSHHIYAAGSWGNIVKSNTPTLVKSICQSWKIRHIAAADNHIILLGDDGCIFGVGDNSMGKLGQERSHNSSNNMSKPCALTFLHGMNERLANKLNLPFGNRSNRLPERENMDFCRRNNGNYPRCERFPRAQRQYRPNGRLGPCGNKFY